MDKIDYDKLENAICNGIWKPLVGAGIGVLIVIGLLFSYGYIQQYYFCQAHTSLCDINIGTAPPTVNIGSYWECHVRGHTDITEFDNSLDIEAGLRLSGENYTIADLNCKQKWR